MAVPRRQFIDSTYGQIHLRTATPETPVEPPLYCLHMSPKSGRSYVNFMRAASDDRIVVAPDYPGYGESDPPPADPHVTIADYAQSVWQVADALGHKKIDLFGNHTGAQVALEMIHQAPDRVNKTVMVSATIFTNDELAAFAEYFSPVPLDEGGSRFKIMWEKIKAHAGPNMTLEMMADSLAENLRSGEAYEWGHEAAFAYVARFKELLGVTTHPITIINPGDELFEPTKRARELLRNGKIIDHPEWGHGFLDAFTDEAVKAVKDALL